MGTDRTSSGHLTVKALREGQVEKTGWKTQGDTHVLRLQLFREKPKPPLYRVEHRVFRKGGKMHVRSELFDQINLARQHFERVRFDPPRSYDDEE